jgi:type I restriction enzyme S subunit
MSKAWPLVPLGEVVTHRKEFIRINDLETYKRCRVQLHAQGIVLRDIVPGAEIKTKEQQVCRAGEFLVAEIDAKVGGFGIVLESLDGAIVSSHYFLFFLNEALLDRRFLDFFIRTPAFREQVSAQGSTNYAAIRPKDVLGYKMPIPPLPEQRRIVARIEELAAKIEEARGLRRLAVEEAEALVPASARRLLGAVSSEITELHCWLDRDRDGIQTGPFGAQLSSHDFVDNGVPVLTIGNVQYGGLELGSLKYLSEEKARQLDRYIIREGDILFARMGTVGRCCVVPGAASGWLINYHIIRVALDKARIDPRYVHWTIRASTDVERYLGEKIRGATRQGVNSAIVGSLPCRVPSLFEQHSIVTYLDSLQTKVDALKLLQAETTAELGALLPSVLDKAFKGEL